MQVYGMRRLEPVEKWVYTIDENVVKAMQWFECGISKRRRRQKSKVGPKALEGIG